MKIVDLIGVVGPFLANRHEVRLLIGEYTALCARVAPLPSHIKCQFGITINNAPNADIIPRHQAGSTMKRALFSITFVLAQAFALAAEGPFIGAWKLNVQKSKFVNQRPSSATYVIRAEGEKLRWDWEATGIDPATGRTGYEGSHTLASLDGTPAVMNTPLYDHVSMKLKDPRTIDVKFTKDGKFVRQDQFTVSQDGKTLTVKRGDSDALIVYDKQ